MLSVNCLGVFLFFLLDFFFILGLDEFFLFFFVELYCFLILYVVLFLDDLLLDFDLLLFLGIFLYVDELELGFCFLLLLVLVLLVFLLLLFLYDWEVLVDLLLFCKIFVNCLERLFELLIEWIFFKWVFDFLGIVLWFWLVVDGEFNWSCFCFLLLLLLIELLLVDVFLFLWIRICIVCFILFRFVGSEIFLERKFIVFFEDKLLVVICFMERFVLFFFEVDV